MQFSQASKKEADYPQQTYTYKKKTMQKQTKTMNDKQ